MTALVLVEATVFVVDVIQPDVVLFSYLNLPVVLAIGLGRPRLTAVFAATSIGLGLITASVNDYFASPNGWARLILMIIVSLVSIALTMAVQRNRIAREHAAARLLEEHVRLQSAEARFRTLAIATSDVILQLDEDLKVEWASPALKAASGWTPREIEGVRAFDLLHPDDLRDVVLPQIAAPQTASQNMTVRARQRGGDYRWVEIVADRFPAPATGWVVRIHDAEEQVRARHELQYLADRDPLTGLLNRRGAEGKLTALLSERRSGQHTALLFADLDGFKQTNDQYGHDAGDTVLQEMGERIPALLRDSDFVARAGGDELVVVLGGVHGLPEAISLAERIRRRCAEPIAISDGHVVTTLSIGVAIAHDGEDAASLIRRADKGLYQAKAVGGNTVQVAPE